MEAVMSMKNKTVLRWSMLVGYLGLIVMMLACLGFSVGTNRRSGLLEISNNVVTVVDKKGDSIPVAGTSTFDLTSPLENTNPWTVAGKTLQTNSTTQIDDGLKAGDLVHVRGTVLEDGTWLAYSIEHAADQTQPVIVLIGKVTSVNPWVVNGITLNVTNDTKIQGTITPGMLVRVEIQLLADGTWKTLSITPVGDITDVSGCAQVIATVVSVNGDQIQFVGWPITVTLPNDVKIVSSQNANGEDEQGENENDNEGNENSNDNTNANPNEATATAQPGGQVVLAPNQVVLVVLCNSNGQVVITQIIILNLNSDNEGSSTENGGKVTICHKPDKKGGHTITVDAAAVPAHMAHGDKMGPCP
jgi:uncharacterized protein DUF5666